MFYKVQTCGNAVLNKSAAAAKSLQSCLTLCDPIDGSPPGSPSLEFSRQEHWSGLGECKSIQPLWRIIWRFLFKKLGIKLPYDPAIPLLGIYPEKSTILKDACTPAFTAAPFTIART